MATTRICVKNLPKSIDEGRLRKHFSSRGGEVTDVKVLKTKEGKARRMAFIGYKSQADAQNAKGYFHGSFLDTSRLVVEEAKPRGDSTLARPWSKYSEGSSKFKQRGAGSTNGGATVVVVEKGAGKRQRVTGGGGGGMDPRDEEQDEGDDDDDGDSDGGKEGEDGRAKRKRIEKEEFLAAMMPRSRMRAWANDDVLTEAVTSSTKKKQKRQREAGVVVAPAAAEEGSDGDAEEEEEEEEQEQEKKGRKQGGKVVEQQEEELSGLDFLRSKVKKGLEKEVAVEEQEGEEGGRGTVVVEAEPVPMEVVDGEEEVEEKGEEEETARLFIRNLPFTASEEELQEELERYGGAVSEVHMPLDDATRKKGFAFAQFILPEDAKKAMAALNGKPFQGRLLHIVPAKEPPKDALSELDPSQARTYKERKEIERRKRAGDDRGWNSSFLRSETVVDAVADRLGIDKGAVLERDSSGMAVRLAVGETTLLTENREFFEKEGVDLRALEGASKGTKASSRSKTTILVKNLPYTTSEEELTKLFGRFGSLSRVLLPPSRSIGLVDFLEPSEARRAFKSLAYKRFQHVPLYLEWAPLGIIKPPSAVPPTTTTTATEAAPAAGATKAAVIEAKAGDEDEDEEERGTSFTLFIKNLSFKTTEETLRQALEKRTQGVRAVIIPKKTAAASTTTTTKGKQQQQLSLGFGFVEYINSNAAKEALKQLKQQGVIIDGHTLECKLSSKRLTPAPSLLKASANKKRTKLVVRNVAFQATVKELKELFGTFGKVKTARIPKKFDGSHRGFAFVEFVTAKEAAQAFEALSATHLYGRHLVIEWAEDAEDLETLREKAGKDAARAARAAAAGGGIGDYDDGDGFFDE